MNQGEFFIDADHKVELKSQTKVDHNKEYQVLNGKIDAGHVILKPTDNPDIYDATFYFKDKPYFSDFEATAMYDDKIQERMNLAMIFIVPKS